MVDEYKPKCYLCNRSFENVERLREHQSADHKEFFEHHQGQKRESAPGDVTVF